MSKATCEASVWSSGACSEEERWVNRLAVIPEIDGHLTSKSGATLIYVHYSSWFYKHVKNLAKERVRNLTAKSFCSGGSHSAS